MAKEKNWTQLNSSTSARWVNGWNCHSTTPSKSSTIWLQFLSKETCWFSEETVMLATRCTCLGKTPNSSKTSHLFNWSQEECPSRPLWSTIARSSLWELSKTNSSLVSSASMEVNGPGSDYSLIIIVLVIIWSGVQSSRASPHHLLSLLLGLPRSLLLFQLDFHVNSSLP